MNVAIICSNAVPISKNSKRGTEIFDYVLISGLAKFTSLDITAFASADSELPVKIDSAGFKSSLSDASVIEKNKHIIFELLLISKAFSSQDKFDLYHANIGDGDIILPFAAFVKKPILITLHFTQAADYIDKYFSNFAGLKHVYFVSISNAQRKFFPKLNYAGTIYHGIETPQFTFSPVGGDSIIWAGRGVPDKGLDTVIKVAKEVGRKAKLFPLIKKEHINWLRKLHSDAQNLISEGKITMEFDKDRERLVEEYQSSKLSLFPINWDEAFGLVLIEALSCGTPVVAYNRGSIPEIIKDGETGFIVNPDEKTKGNWVIKKSGVEGLIEAVERIYAMPDQKYQQMRQNCRRLVEEKFSSERMAKDYLKVYQTISASLD